MRIVMHTDNIAVVYILNKTTSKDVKIMALTRRLVVTCMLANIHFKAQHVPGLLNTQADLLSRLQVDAFRRQTPWAKERPVCLPVDIQPCNWCLG